MSIKGDPVSIFKLKNPIAVKFDEKIPKVKQVQLDECPDILLTKVTSIAKYCNERDCFGIGMSCRTDAECGPRGGEGDYRCIYGTCYYCP